MTCSARFVLTAVLMDVLFGLDWMNRKSFQ